MKRRIFLSAIVILSLFLYLSAEAGKIKVYDLGVVGKATPVDVEKLRANNEQYIEQKNIKPDTEKLQQILKQVQAPKLSFQTAIPAHSGKAVKTRKQLKTKVPLPAGTKMLYFTCNNSIPQKVLADISYGYCLGFNSLEDIKKFREGNKVKFPVQPLLDDKILQWLDISSLPAVVTVKGDTLEVQEGF